MKKLVLFLTPFLTVAQTTISLNGTIKENIVNANTGMLLVRTSESLYGIHPATKEITWENSDLEKVSFNAYQEIPFTPLVAFEKTPVVNSKLLTSTVNAKGTGKTFQDTIKILKIRGNAMQNSVPKGEGGMTAILGASIKVVENLLSENQNNFKVEIANDNSEGQIVLSGKISDLEKLNTLLKEKKIKNIRLPVSAPFHCSLMNVATEIMKEELSKLNFKKGDNTLISNITADEIFNADELKDLLIKQIENRVRWRESTINMINKGVKQFIEIGPGKVLSGLVKRINKEVEVTSINSEDEIKNIKI